MLRLFQWAPKTGKASWGGSCSPGSRVQRGVPCILVPTWGGEGGGERVLQACLKSLHPVDAPSDEAGGGGRYALPLCLRIVHSA